MKPCKHGHADGALHKPCPICRADRLAESVQTLQSQCTALVVGKLDAEHSTKLAVGLLRRAGKWLSNIEDSSRDVGDDIKADSIRKLWKEVMTFLIDYKQPQGPRT